MKNLRSRTVDKLVTFGLVIVAYLVIQILLTTGAVTSSAFKGLLVPVSIYILLAVSLNLVVGVSGELSLGHAGFMCIGAFVGSVVSLSLGEMIPSVWLRFPLAILCGGISAGFMGFLIGIPVLRLRGDYLAIVTLAFGEIIKNIFNNIYLSYDANGIYFAMSPESFSKFNIDMATKHDIIKGAMGISGTPKDTTFTICFVVILIALFVMLNLIDSKTGRSIKAARDNRIAAEAMGINVTRAKMTAFVVSAFFAGVAGVLYSHNLTQLNATKFDYNTSILILVFVVLGGMGKMRGSIIAAAILYALPEALRGLSDCRMILYAVVLIVMMILNNNAQFRAFKSKFSVKAISAKLSKKGGKA